MNIFSCFLQNNIAHALITPSGHFHLGLCNTSLDYITDYTDVLQAPVLTFAPTNRAYLFLFIKKVEL